METTTITEFLETEFLNSTSTTTEVLALIPVENVGEEKYVTASVVTLTICVLGIIGNLLSLTVLLNRQMRCFGPVPFLTGLAICDTIVLINAFVNVSENMGLHTSFRGDYSKVARFILAWIGSAGTRYFTVAVSVERFIVVFYPLKASVWMTVKIERIAAVLIGILLILLAWLSYFIRGIVDWKQYSFYSAAIQNFGPFVLVVAFNAATLIRVHKYARTRDSLKGRSQENSTKGKNPSSKNNNESAVTRMLLTVILVFVFCYSFETARRIAHFVWPEYYTKGLWLSYRINLLSDIFYVLNSAVNFIIYCLLGKKFRNVFVQVMKEYLLCCCSKKEKGEGGNGSASIGKSSSNTNTQTSQIELPEA